MDSCDIVALNEELLEFVINYIVENMIEWLQWIIVKATDYQPDVRKSWR